MTQMSSLRATEVLYTLKVTRRQREILPLLAEGLSDLEIAGRLSIGVQTVKSQVLCLYARFGARNRTHCVHRAHQMGVLSGEADE